MVLLKGTHRDRTFCFPRLHLWDKYAKIAEKCVCKLIVFCSHKRINVNQPSTPASPGKSLFWIFYSILQQVLITNSVIYWVSIWLPPIFHIRITEYMAHLSHQPQPACILNIAHAKQMCLCTATPIKVT